MLHILKTSLQTYNKNLIIEDSTIMWQIRICKKFIKKQYTYIVSLLLINPL